MGANPSEHGYEKVGEKNGVAKYVKEVNGSRKVLYRTDEGAVRVNEAARVPNIVHASPDFFFSETLEGLLFENERADTVDQAHAMAQEKIASLISD